MIDWIIVYTNEIGITENTIVSTHNYFEIKDIENDFKKLHPKWKVISIKKREEKKP